MSMLCVLVPPRVLFAPQTKAVSLAQRVLLHCPAGGGDPPPQIIWSKMNQPVLLDSRIQQLANGSLVIYDSTVKTFQMHSSISAVTYNYKTKSKVYSKHTKKY